MSKQIAFLFIELFITSAISAKDIQRIAESGFNYYNVRHKGKLIGFQHGRY